MLGCAPAQSADNSQPTKANNAQESAPETSTGSTALQAPKLNAKPDPSTDPDGIHNVMKVSETIFSGSEPEGDEGFASLAKLGIKTVITVDGGKPNVEAAHRHGMRYVHIPIGYDGVPEEAGQALARAVREVEKPIYVHCHHGQHRGPTGAAIACVASGALTNKQAVQILERAGTSKDYPGLWRDVAAYKPPGPGVKLPELVEVAHVDSFPAAMAQIDHAFDNVKMLQASAWKAPAKHPDIVPAQEALLLQEALHEVGRNLVADRDEPFKARLAEADAIAAQLRDDLKKNDTKAASEQLLKLDAACKQCHKKYRDNGP
jgi:protein tyrosine phosphatase (PTP) superfamily phosphohydrolase (DUF442 family)/cytochrome c556